MSINDKYDILKLKLEYLSNEDRDMEFFALYSVMIGAPIEGKK